jgi:hypothetical protein
MGVLDIAERLKEDWLYNSYTMARDAIQKEGDVFAWVIPLEQWDRSEAIELVRILRRAGVEVHRAISPFLVGDKSYGAGSYLAYGGQAFRGFIAHILDKQAYPGVPRSATVFRWSADPAVRPCWLDVSRRDGGER